MATILRAPIAAPQYLSGSFNDYGVVVAAYHGQIQEAAKAEHPGNDMVGRVVRFSVADGYAEYVVWNTKPLQLVWLETGDAYSISVSHARGLRLADIEPLVEYDKRTEAMFEAHEDFYANLPVGTIVHYDNGFAQFVRCVRVAGPKGKRLQPLALVGNWQDYDLPRREVDGSINDRYHVRMIREGECFEPNYGSIWERYDAKGREWAMRICRPPTPTQTVNFPRYEAPFDPTVEPPLSLEVPPLDDEAERVAALVRKIGYIYHLCSEQPDEATAEEYEAILDRVRAEVA